MPPASRAADGDLVVNESGRLCHAVIHRAGDRVRLLGEPIHLAAACGIRPVTHVRDERLADSLAAHVRGNKEILEAAVAGGNSTSMSVVSSSRSRPRDRGHLARSRHTSRRARPAARTRSPSPRLRVRSRRTSDSPAKAGSSRRDRRGQVTRCWSSANHILGTDPSAFPTWAITVGAPDGSPGPTTPRMQKTSEHARIRRSARSDTHASLTCTPRPLPKAAAQCRDCRSLLGRSVWKVSPDQLPEQPVRAPRRDTGRALLPRLFGRHQSS